jgi:EAL domain-containing protein (putative c-di-GMP-specific phosphodiesterase class I)
VNEVCQQINTWRAAGIAVPHVAVNLSGRSFHQKGLRRTSDTLRQHGLAAHDLLLEITESVMMDAREVTQENIELLSQQGFRLSLDDFGTGYSSLSYLHRLPITELKDKSFVQPGTQRNGPSAHDFRAEHRKSLGMTVVAEGVKRRSSAAG